MLAAAAGDGDEGGAERKQRHLRCPYCTMRAVKPFQGGRKCYNCGKRQAEDGSDVPAKRPRTDGDTRRPRNEHRPYPHMIAFGYTGSGLKGLQWTAQFDTVEGKLVSALRGAGVVNCDASDRFFRESRWTRASRTDAGVHAAVNVVGLRCEAIPDTAAALSKINESLRGSGVEVYSIERVMGPFDAREAAGERTYRYALPTFAFCSAASVFSAENRPAEAAPLDPAAVDPKPGHEVEVDVGGEYHPATLVGTSARRDSFVVRWGDGAVCPAVRQCDVRCRETKRAIARTHSAVPCLPRDPTADEAAALRRLAATEEDRRRFESVLRSFEGTHQFRNFSAPGAVKNTSKTDETYRRTVTGFKVEYLDMGGVDTALITVTGTSFVLHQIRAMVGSAVAVFAAGAGPTLLRSLLDPSQHRCSPLAPAEGLWLDHIEFGPYNRRLDKMRKGSKDGLSSFRALAPVASDSVRAAVLSEVRQNVAATAAFVCGLRSRVADMWGVDIADRERPVEVLRYTPWSVDG
eukprot:TRINITY_DN8731_c0_g1_i1.p1 TRINITY_DN8731_c0_g1~~TRINITY_DN8731_c0_g1_i1.p1  ORF type:complete len:549 (+),score=140.73 TRINITY_DN8731_c0_g1_i1:93-1649(+)